MLNNHHPDYDRMEEDWVVMQDTYAGERAVKEKGETYLPATPAMVIDGMKNPNDVGTKAYERYKMRAVFWDFVSEAVERLVGMMHQKPANIKLPAVMEPLRNKASREGETMQQLLRRINEQQLVYGRIGLLADLPDVVTTDVAAIPYVALYHALSIVNWDASHDDVGLDVKKLIVLDETAPERNSEFTWREIVKFRVLQMSGPIIDPASGQPALEATSDTAVELPLMQQFGNTYFTGVFRYTENSIFDQNQMKAPMYKGRLLDEIPFEFINSKDVVSTPDKPPLLGLANLCLAIYRGEADYRQSLFMQGQDTLVVIGGNPEVDPTLPGDTNPARRVGAGAVIDVNLGGDAKYIGVGATGLPEQRTALENDKLSASTKAGQLVSPQAGKQESGDALTTRISAQTASITQIAKTGAAGLERILKTIAKWMGANPEEVMVEANTEFLDHLMTSKDLSDFMDARMKGAPMSLKSIHDNMIARGMTELTFEEEIAQIIVEQTLKGAQPVEPPSVTAAAVKPASAAVGAAK